MHLSKRLLTLVVTGLLVTSSLGELTKVTRRDGVNPVGNALEKRDRKTIGQGGLETGGSSTELYTEGLSTCIGAAAIGTEDGEKKIDKALAHVSSGATGASFQTQFDDWKQAILDSKMTDVSLYLSVPAVDIIPAACRAMGDMIDYAKKTCKDLGAGCATLERKNEDKDKAPPFGTVLIKEDRQVEMEGKVVSANVGIGR